MPRISGSTSSSHQKKQRFSDQQSSTANTPQFRNKQKQFSSREDSSADHLSNADRDRRKLSLATAGSQATPAFIKSSSSFNESHPHKIGTMVKAINSPKSKTQSSQTQINLQLVQDTDNRRLQEVLYLTDQQGTQLEHATTFGENFVLMASNLSGEEDEYVSTAQQKQPPKLRKLQTVHQNKIGRIPKFMEKGEDGQMRMIRMLYLNEQELSESSSKSSGTNSLRTDTSMEGVSVDSNYKIQKTQVQQEECKEVKVINQIRVSQLEPSCNQVQENQNTEPPTPQIDSQLKSQKVTKPIQTHSRVRLTRVSETDEEYSKSFYAGNTVGEELTSQENMSRSNKVLGSERTSLILSQLGLVGLNLNQEPKPQILTPSASNSQTKDNPGTNLVTSDIPRDYSTVMQSKRNQRHSMLVTNRKVDKNNELEKGNQTINKLFTQLYKFDNDLITSLLGGAAPPSYQENKTETESQGVDNAGILGTSIGNTSKQQPFVATQQSKFQSQQQLQKVLLSQRQQKNSSQKDSSSASLLMLPPTQQPSNQIRNPQKISSQRRSSGRSRSNRTRFNQNDENNSSKKGGPSSGIIKETSSAQSSYLKSMSSSIGQGQTYQNHNNRLNSTPKKRLSTKVIDIIAETAIFEDMLRKIYGPRKIINENNGLTSPLNKFKSQQNQDQVASKFENFHATFTIKEATEDLEQSSKGGSQAFRSKNLIQAKVSTAMSQKDKKTEQEGEGSQSHLGIENMMITPSLQQSLSFNQSRQRLKSNCEPDEKMVESVNLDDFSEINLQLPTINKDKRFSNPDPIDRKIRRMETLFANSVHIKNHKAKQQLIKQLTQDLKSPEFQLIFQHPDFYNPDDSNQLINNNSRKQQVESNLHLNESPTSRREKISDVTSASPPFQDQKSGEFIGYGNPLQTSPTVASPLTAQFKTQKLTASFLNDRDQNISTEFQPESPTIKLNTQYRFGHGSQNFRGKNLIRAVKQVSRRTNFTPDGNNPHLSNLLDLTRSKVLLDFVGGVRDVDQEAIKLLKAANAKRIQDTVQLAQLDLQSQLQLTRNADSSPSNKNVRLSFETNGLSPMIFTEGFIQFQDDFTPSNCQRFEHSSSDINSSAYNQHLSQLEPFNPDLYEMEAVYNSSEISQVQTSLYHQSLQNSKTPNQKEILIDQQLQNKLELSGNYYFQRQKNQQSQAENFTQHLIASNNTIQQLKNVQEFGQANLQNQNRKITTTETMHPMTSSVTGSGSIIDQLSSQYSPITLKQHNSSQIALQAKQSSDLIKQYPLIEIKLENQAVQNTDDINMPQPSRRYTSSNYQTDHQSDNNSLPRGSIEVKPAWQQPNSFTARSDNLKEEIKDDEIKVMPLQLHPELVKLLNKEETNQLSACIPKLQMFMSTPSPGSREPQSMFQQVARVYGDKIRVMYGQKEHDNVGEDRTQKSEVHRKENKLISQVLKGVNQRFQRAMTQASDARCGDRRRQVQENGSLHVSNYRTQRKKPHISITTTSMVSSKQQGMVRINQYQILQKIGEGKFAKVKLCVDVNTNQYYAAKIINKERIRRKLMTRPQLPQAGVNQEMAIMKKLDHPFILKLYEIIDDPTEKKLYLITEFVKNGNLEKKVKSSPEWLTSSECPDMRVVFRQLIEALDYCHSVVNIIHRDIKPENILIDESDNIKLADFGVSSMLPVDGTDFTTSNAGSALFFSPEACNGKQYRGKLNDLWACGVTLYFMCTGKYPFDGNNHAKLFEQIKLKAPEFPPHLNGTKLKDLISLMLEKNEQERITLGQIKVHPYVTNEGQLPPIPDHEDATFEQPSTEDVNNLINKVKKNVKYIIRKKSKVGIDSKSAI